MQPLKSIFAVIAALSLSGTGYARAQEFEPYHSVGVSWGVSVPVGNSFLERTSFIAPRVEWEWRIVPPFAFGLDAGLVRSSESGFTNDRVDGNATSGHSTREGSAFALTAYGRWYVLPHARLLSPYVGVGVGTEYFSARITGEVINTSENKAWDLTARAEVGIRIHPRRNGRLSIDLRGGYTYSGYEWKYVDNLKNDRIGVSLGIGYRFTK